MVIIKLIEGLLNIKCAGSIKWRALSPRACRVLTEVGVTSHGNGLTASQASASGCGFAIGLGLESRWVWFAIGMGL